MQHRAMLSETKKIKNNPPIVSNTRCLIFVINQIMHVISSMSFQIIPFLSLDPPEPSFHETMIKLPVRFLRGNITR